MNANQKIEAALSELVDGNIWPLSKPEESNPDNWITYNPEIDLPGDFGDDTPLEWVQHFQIHWFKKGVANYLKTRKIMRKLLVLAGFSISDITCLKEGKRESASSGEYTHLIFSCSIIEDGFYGEIES